MTHVISSSHIKGKEITDNTFCSTLLLNQYAENKYQKSIEMPYFMVAWNLFYFKHRA